MLRVQRKYLTNKKSRGRASPFLTQGLAWILINSCYVFEFVLGYRTMKSPEIASRAMRFEAEEKTRKVADLEYMINEFEQIAADLERQIKAEEERTGVRDQAHYNYSTFARSATQRRENLLASAEGLKERLDSAVRERDEFLEQVDRHSTVEPRSNMSGRRTRGAATTHLR